MYRPLHAHVTDAETGVPEMETLNSARQFGAVPHDGSIRFSRDLPHRGRKQCGVAAPAFKSPLFGARRENLRKITSRQQRKAEARHFGSAREFTRGDRQS